MQPRPPRQQSGDGDIGFVDMLRKICLVVPFYKNPQLVRPLFDSLAECADELRQYRVNVCFFNDSPADDDLRIELDHCIQDKKGIDLTVENNSENLGFIGTINRALDGAIERREDVLLLNSDTCFFPGVISELVQAAYSDPMIGFVSPRSNNATLCTLPHGSGVLDISPKACFARYQAIARSLPKLSYVPTATGFCLFIKWNILVDLGGFDIQYGAGYNEENDLIMRANRLGYQAVLANHAFVWHQGEQSFNATETARSLREKKNSKLLCLRYPEYLPLIDKYYHSPEYEAEHLLGGLCPDAQGKLTVGFDFSNFGTYHNGTFEAGKRLLFSAARCWPENIRMVVFMGQQSWAFHKLEACSRAERVDPHDLSGKIAAVVRMGQPFDTDAVKRLVTTAPVVAVFMLDTIAADCGYLRNEFDQLLWHFTLKWFDVIFTNSQFTADQFSRRYFLGKNTILFPSIHSISPNEYISDRQGVTHRIEEIGAEISGGRNVRLLVIGNKFAHKDLEPTVRNLAMALPMVDILALGCASLEYGNVQCVDTGNLSNENLDVLYAGVDAIVFPSHYEGFGFPILHALASKKPIYVRKLPVFEEIVSRIEVGGGNVHWFESRKDLVEQLTGGVAGWIGSAAEGEDAGWDRSANEVFQVLSTRMATVRHEAIVDRLRWFSAVFSDPYEYCSVEQNQVKLARRFIIGKFDRVLKMVLSSSVGYNILRYAWQLVKAIRGCLKRA